MILHSARYRNAYSRLLFETELFRSLKHPFQMVTTCVTSQSIKWITLLHHIFKIQGLWVSVLHRGLGGGESKRNQGDHSEEKKHDISGVWSWKTGKQHEQSVFHSSHF